MEEVVEVDTKDMEDAAAKVEDQDVDTNSSSASNNKITFVGRMDLETTLVVSVATQPMDTNGQLQLVIQWVHQMRLCSLTTTDGVGQEKIVEFV